MGFVVEEVEVERHAGDVQCATHMMLETSRGGCVCTLALCCCMMHCMRCSCRELLLSSTGLPSKMCCGCIRDECRDLGVEGALSSNRADPALLLLLLLLAAARTCIRAAGNGPFMHVVLGLLQKIIMASHVGKCAAAFSHLPRLLLPQLLLP